jgi:hypothetical protein
MRRRRLLIALAVLLIVAAGIGLLVWLRARAAPEAARLLPDGDAVIYVNLRPLRTASALSSLPEAQRAPEYEEFVRGTGFQFERDLEQAAFAVHLPGSSQNPDQETRFSEVFVGRFDYEKLTDYLRRKSRRVDKYQETEVYTIPVENRTVRAAVLSVDMVAVSNAAQPRALESIIDKARGGGLPVGGPELLREHYRHVPFGSLAWGIAAVSRSGGKNFTIPGGFELPFPQNTILLGSVRYTGNINVKMEAFTPGDEDAKSLAENLSLLLTLFRSIQLNSNAKGSDPDVKAFIESLEVKQDGKRVEVSASITPAFVQKIVQEAPETVAPEPSPEPPKPSKRTRPRK